MPSSRSAAARHQPWQTLLFSLPLWLLAACAAPPPAPCCADSAPAAGEWASEWVGARAAADPAVALPPVAGSLPGTTDRTPVAARQRGPSQPLGNSGNLDQGIAVLAIEAASDQAAINRNLLASELAELIRQRHALPVFSLPRVRDALGAATHTRLQRHIAARGRLDHGDRQRLMAARLPVPSALTLRLSDNRVMPGRTEVQPLRDDQGQPIAGAERVIMATLRQTRVMAELLDLRTGDVYWQREYEAAPAQKHSFTRFRGHTLGRSVAAEIATRLANGLGEPEPPPPPGLQRTLRALLVQIVDDLPLPAG